MSDYLLAIDQGTTNSRAIIFNRAGDVIGQHTMALTQYYPQAGWIEQDPDEMFQHTVECCRIALKNASLSAKQIAAVGISNQRETTIIWDKQTGKPIYPAIVWQDRRTHAQCDALMQGKMAESIQQKTGLILDPYFSATKIAWILKHVEHARERAEKKELLFGTVDSYLVWKLTQGRSHVTDITNASRTMLFNIHTQEWDHDILNQLNIPFCLLPTVLDNTALFGEIDPSILGVNLPITGIAGDQQAATIGQACFLPGMVKATYGTGCFMLLNTGEKLIQSQHQLLSTIVYRIQQQTVYGLEGSIFSAGVTIKWLRDTLKLIETADETAYLANQIESTEGVYLVPAFTGLGAPYWNPHARGSLLGLTRNSGREHIVRAALESVAYQTRDLLEAMVADSGSMLKSLRVDGGMAANNWLLQFLSDTLNLEVQRPTCIETSALGAAYLAGLQIGMYSSLDDIAACWKKEKCFYPQLSIAKRDALYQGWKNAIERVLIKL